MPNGYLVTVGDASLDVNDTIDATQVFFTIGATIGTGGWNWSGIWAGNGSFYSNINDTGTFYEGTDGNVYFIPDTWFTTSGSAYVTSAPAFSLSILVDGTSGADVIDASYSDGDGDQVDAGDGSGPSGHEDTISAGDGNDSVEAGLEDDIVYGGGGSDTLEGGSGNDTLYGDTDDVSPGGAPGNDSILGGSGNDVIFGEGGADSIRGDGAADEIDGGEGNDTIAGDAGADTIRGGLGNDSIDGNDGNDLIGADQASDSSTLDWGTLDENGSFAITGASETMNVTITTTTNGAGQTANVQSHGSPAADGLWVSCLSDPVTTTMTFDSLIENANFEIYDIDQNTGSWDDLLTIVAIDQDGNQVPVVFSDLDGLHSVSGDDLNADGNANTGVETTGADDSVTVDIAGPFVQLIFTFDNGESASNSGLFGVGNMTLDFTVDYDAEPGNDAINGGAGNDTIFAGNGDDSISGGIGSDSLDGQAGNDFFNVGEGDTAIGGDGDDYFQIVELSETPGAGANIFIQGDEGDETTGDTLNLGTLGDRNEIVYSNTDDAAGGLSGTLTLEDGTLLTFENIEKIICFTPGTMIDTPFGQRAVETLKAGDLVTTLDAGAQPIAWTGSRTIPCTPATTPIQFEMGSIDGLSAPLKVSPQHKMLVSHFSCDLLFGQNDVFCTAQHMLNDRVKRVAQKTVT
jgi:Ca2+-binding RTX toxin-like protein